jgi:hypothetical protein
MMNILTLSEVFDKKYFKMNFLIILPFQVFLLYQWGLCKSEEGEFLWTHTIFTSCWQTFILSELQSPNVEMSHHFPCALVLVSFIWRPLHFLVRVIHFYSYLSDILQNDETLIEKNEEISRWKAHINTKKFNWYFVTLRVYITNLFCSVTNSSSKYSFRYSKSTAAFNWTFLQSEQIHNLSIILK